MRDYFSIGGMILASVLAGWINFSHFYDGRGDPTWLNVAVTALVVAFWVAYLMVNRNSPGYLKWSLGLSVGLFLALGLVLVQNTTELPLLLYTLLLLLFFLLVPPFHGLLGFSWPWLLPVCVVLLLLWMGVHLYFLYRLGGQKGDADEA